MSKGARNEGLHAWMVPAHDAGRAAPHLDWSGADPLCRAFSDPRNPR
jgi:hypothetical protein